VTVLVQQLLLGCWSSGGARATGTATVHGSVGGVWGMYMATRTTGLCMCAVTA
jgi:hypothetical protein